MVVCAVSGGLVALFEGGTSRVAAAVAIAVRVDEPDLVRNHGFIRIIDEAVAVVVDAVADLDLAGRKVCIGVVTVKGLELNIAGGLGALFKGDIFCSIAITVGIEVPNGIANGVVIFIVNAAVTVVVIAVAIFISIGEGEGSAVVTVPRGI